MERQSISLNESMRITRRGLLGGLSLLALSACSGGIGLPDLGGSSPTPDANGQNLPAAQGQTFGTGAVRVAMLLPLTGDPALTTIGTSMAGGAQLAMEYISSNANLKDNITLVIKDAGSTAQTAAAAASQAIQEGASLILGPLKSDHVTQAGAVARAANIPLIGFSNNSGAAQPGVYLLNVLPESEVHRSMAYAKAQGKKAFAGIFPSNGYGQIQQSAFQQAAADLGVHIVGVYNFSSEDEARAAVTQVTPTLLAGQIDTLFLPDRGTAPSFGSLLEQAGVPSGGVLIVGSSDWNGDQNILNTPYFVGAVYPAIDDAGYQALLPLYQQRFGGTPHPFVTLAYTAVILANAPSLALGTPKYSASVLTAPGGFSGRDGVFKFLSDGRSQYALVMKKVASGSASVVDPAKI